MKSKNKEKPEKSEELIIDGTGAVLGRLSSYAVKQALGGKKIVIVNAGKVIVVGNERDITEKYKKRIARGGSALLGPFFPSKPERILKRTMRGMIDYKKGRGRETFKAIRCYYDIPEEYKDRKMIKSAGKRRGISLNKISKMIRK